MRHAMPPALLQEVLRVAQTDAPTQCHQDVVIDICAGDRSLWQPTLQAGLHCIGVDIRFNKDVYC